MWYTLCYGNNFDSFMLRRKFENQFRSFEMKRSVLIVNEGCNLYWEDKAQRKAVS